METAAHHLHLKHASALYLTVHLLLHHKPLALFAQQEAVEDPQTLPEPFHAALPHLELAARSKPFLEPGLQVRGIVKADIFPWREDLAAHRRMAGAAQAIEIALGDRLNPILAHLLQAQALCLLFIYMVSDHYSSRLRVWVPRPSRGDVEPRN